MIEALLPGAYRPALDDPDIMSTNVRKYLLERYRGRGWGSSSAARNPVHDYGTDEDGILTRVNLIVAGNNWAMHTAAGSCCCICLHKVAEGMLNTVEALLVLRSMPVLLNARDR
jgi:coenzyme F420-reducing hydrogenase alpha subunit